jgi:HlyD family secretion protein
MKLNCRKVAFTLPLAVAMGCGIIGCESKEDNSFPGYAEGEYVRIASPYAGNLANLNVKRGDKVEVNAPLFALEQESERAAREEAVARVQQSEARLANLRKGKRPDEVATVRAQLAQAEAAVRLSQTELKRTEQLVAAKFLSPAKLDEIRATNERDRSRVVELAAQVKVANLAGRSDEIIAAEADVSAARQQLAQAQWRLAQKSLRAPRSAAVVDTFYSTGEWIQAGMPVLSLLPPENIKLKFFIAEKLLSQIKIGQEIAVVCDGCAATTARVSFISPQAEYTSPIIYSKENRATLVFLVEARPKAEDAIKLHPGQPVEIKL